MNIFDQVRQSCEYVADRSQWVKVNVTNALLYPEKLNLADSQLSHTPEHHYLDKDEDTLKFFLILDTINFGSGYFPYLDKEKGVSGYFTIAKRLKEFVEKNGIPEAGYFEKINPQECSEIFRQDISNKHAYELMCLFSAALSELGRWINANHNGDFLGFLKESATADGAVRQLMSMSFFRDLSKYYDKDILFLKRAQILLQDMKLALPEHPLINFPDIDQLTIFADNVLPYVLFTDGILEYDEWIRGRIEREELIGSGSIEEIELRACTIYATELIADVIREECRPISVRELDYKLWMRGQTLKKQVSFKRHRTRCVFY